MSAVLESRSSPAAARPQVATTAGDTVPEEARILERCAREIALEAGVGARVVELGGRASRGTALIEAGIAALPRRPARDASGRRRVVFVSAARTGAMTEARLTMTLRRIRDLSPADALLVVAVATPHGDSLARFARLAAAAAWEHRQLWSDGRARFAVHVLARIAIDSEEDAHVIET